MRSGDDPNWRYPVDRDAPGPGPANVRLLRQLEVEREGKRRAARRNYRPVIAKEVA